MKKILLFGVFVFIFLFSLNPVFAEKYYVKNLEVVVKVQEDGSFIVSENIDVYFTDRAHGIIRAIPKKGDKIKDVFATNVNAIYTTGGILNVQFGDPDNLVIGDVNYKLKYKTIPKKAMDEFYLDIVGNKWETDINQATFKVIMPKTFDSKKVQIYSGGYGSETNKNHVSYSVENNVITGHTTKKLKPKEGIGIFIFLPKGYFKNSMFLEKQICIFLISLFTLFVYFIWYLYGKEDHVTPVVTFYPPKNLDALDSEVILKMKASERGFVSYIIELASKNYIKIDEQKNSFTLTKLQENCTKLSKREEKIINIIFGNKTSVTKDELSVSRTFYKKVDDILLDVNDSMEKIFCRDSIDFRTYILPVLLTICTVYTTAYALNNYDSNGIFVIFLSFSLFLVLVSTFYFSKNIMQKAIYSIILLVFVSIFCKGVVLFGIICSVVCAVCIIELPKRSTYGNKILGELLGLKHFIKTAEKNKLEKMIRNNPSYFYNILPYAYLLDVSDVWINQFEDIFAKYTECNGAHFTSSSFSNFTNSMQTCSIPTSQNGGISHSSSGGGFSGGGHGGGGASSW